MLLTQTSVPAVLDQRSRAIAGVLERLTDAMADMSPQLRKAAAFVLDHPSEVGLASVRELADAAGVKPNTLVRMARATGFDGFDDFRAPFRDDLRMNSFSSRAHWLQELSAGGKLGSLYAEIVNATMTNLQRTFTGVTAEELTTIADAIVASRRTYVIGVGANYALAQNFAYLAGMAVEHVVAVPREGNVPMDTVVRAGAADVVVAMTFEPYRSEVVAAARAAHRQDATIVAITDSHGSPIAIGADYVLLAATDTPQFFPSTLAAAALLETLASFIVADSRKEVVQAIEPIPRTPPTTWRVLERGPMTSTAAHGDASRYTAPQRAMDPSVYLDPAVYEQDVRTVLASSWQYACHASDIPEPGDYVAFDVAGESLFIVRESDGSVGTFFNVCMHRGHLLLDGRGSRRQITCPYHAWAYRLDGTLRRAPHAEGRAGFDANEICLTSVRTEDFHGFLFVNLDDEASSMDEEYPGIREALTAFLPTIDRMRPLERREFVADSNWKIAVENYNECYHCKVAHPSFSKGVVLPDSYSITPVGRCLHHHAESAPDQYYDIDYDASPNAARYASFYLWPLFSFQVYPGPVLNTFCWRPESVDRTPFAREWFTLEGVDSDTVRTVAEEDANTTVAEDLRLVRSVQRGLASRGYRPGPLILDPDMGVNSEHTVAAIKEWYLEGQIVHEAGRGAD